MRWLTDSQISDLGANFHMGQAWTSSRATQNQIVNTVSGRWEALPWLPGKEPVRTEPDSETDFSRMLDNALMAAFAMHCAFVADKSSRPVDESISDFDTILSDMPVFTRNVLLGSYVQGDGIQGEQASQPAAIAFQNPVTDAISGGGSSSGGGGGGTYDDTALRNRVIALEQARVSGDNALSARITAEANTRLQDDNALDTRVGRLESSQITDTTIYKGVWSPDTNYEIGDLVRLSNRFFIAEFKHTNSRPTASNANWGQVDNIFLGEWKSTTGYHSGDIVTVGNDVFFAIADSSNAHPNSSPRNWVQINNGSGQGLTPEQKTKLDGIDPGAEVNVQSDWAQTDSTADDFIKNKPGTVGGGTGLQRVTTDNTLTGDGTSGSPLSVVEQDDPTDTWADAFTILAQTDGAASRTLPPSATGADQEIAVRFDATEVQDEADLGITRATGRTAFNNLHTTEDTDLRVGGKIKVFQTNVPVGQISLIHREYDAQNNVLASVVIAEHNTSATTPKRVFDLPITNTPLTAREGRTYDVFLRFMTTQPVAQNSAFGVEAGADDANVLSYLRWKADTLQSGIASVASDASITGDGTEARPLAVAVPLTISERSKLRAAPTSFAPTNAEQNVQADWNVTDSNSDAFIRNKPVIPTGGGGGDGSGRVAFRGNFVSDLATQYEAGDVVIYRNNLYMAQTQIGARQSVRPVPPAGSGVGANWIQISPQEFMGAFRPVNALPAASSLGLRYWLDAFDNAFHLPAGLYHSINNPITERNATAMTIAQDPANAHIQGAFLDPAGPFGSIVDPRMLGGLTWSTGSVKFVNARLNTERLGARTEIYLSFESSEFSVAETRRFKFNRGSTSGNFTVHGTTYRTWAIDNTEHPLSSDALTSRLMELQDTTGMNDLRVRVWTAATGNTPLNHIDQFVWEPILGQKFLESVLATPKREDRALEGSRILKDWMQVTGYAGDSSATADGILLRDYQLFATRNAAQDPVLKLVAPAIPGTDATAGSVSRRNRIKVQLTEMGNGEGYYWTANQRSNLRTFDNVQDANDIDPDRRWGFISFYNSGGTGNRPYIQIGLDPTWSTIERATTLANLIGNRIDSSDQNIATLDVNLTKLTSAGLASFAGKQYATWRYVLNSQQASNLGASGWLFRNDQVEIDLKFTITGNDAIPFNPQTAEFTAGSGYKEATNPVAAKIIPIGAGGGGGGGLFTGGENLLSAQHNIDATRRDFPLSEQLAVGDIVGVRFFTHHPVDMKTFFVDSLVNNISIRTTMTNILNQRIIVALGFGNNSRIYAQVTSSQSLFLQAVYKLGTAG